MCVRLSPAADLLLYGGRVLTLDPYLPKVEAVAIADGKILAVGTETKLRSLCSPRTEFLSCKGRTILPGFIDPHLHLFAWASRFCGVDLSTACSLAEIQKRLADRLPRVPSGEWLRGYGYDEFFLAEKRHPTKHDLDAVSLTHPILLRHRTGHAAILNSVALQRAGIDKHFSSVDGGTVERDNGTGEPTGVVYELEHFLRTVIPPLSSPDLKTGVAQANAELLRQGVTSFHDASAGNTLADLALFRRFYEEGILTPRATVMVGAAALPQVLAAGLTFCAGDDQVRLGSVKIMVHESRGTFHPPLEELTDLVWQAHSNGFQVAIHAVEEGPVCLALAAIEHALARQPRAQHRHRIEHCSLCPPPFIDTLAATGCTVVTQPGFLYFYGEKYAADVTPDLHNWLYRTRSLLERNIPVAGSSDCPIAPLAPLRGVQTAVTRRARTGLVLNPAEGLALTDAFALFTKAGAWVGFEETKKGRILPGMLADLIVLNEDIVTVPVEEVGALQVATTIIGGIVVWSSL